MSDCSDNMFSRLNQVKLQTNELISKTNQLQNQKLVCSEKKILFFLLKNLSQKKC